MVRDFFKRLLPITLDLQYLVNVNILKLCRKISCKYTSNFQTCITERKKKEMHACTMLLLPWVSLVAMEFSDPETKPSPNQFADVHKHTLELLITKPNSSPQGWVSSLKMSQTVKSQNIL